MLNQRIITDKRIILCHFAIKTPYTSVNNQSLTSLLNITSITFWINMKATAHASSINKAKPNVSFRHYDRNIVKKRTRIPTL